MSEYLHTEIQKKHERSFSEKKIYLHFIFQLGQRGLTNLFSFPMESLSLWWFSLVAEKPPFKSNAYKKLISILVTSKGSDRNDGQLSFKESKLYHFLKGWINIVRLMFRIIHARMGIGRLKQRKAVLAAQDYTIVSYFPYLDKEKEQQGIFENRYLSAFHRELASKRQARYGHVCISVDIDGFGFSDSVRLANKFSSRESLFLIEEFISTCDVLQMIWHYVCFSFRYVLKTDSIRKLLHYRSDSVDIDAWPILRNDFHSSFCGTQLATSLFYIAAFRNMAALLNKGSKLICVCEMQWWERALYHFARKNGLLTIGYQHSIAPVLLLNYFNAPEEMGWDGDGINHCPLPDYLATVGSVTAELFIKNGWPEERVFPWGAQRFESLKNLINKPISWEQRENLVVCAFSICPKEAEQILGFLLDAFSGNAPKYKIYLKSHPSLDIRKVVNDLGIRLNQAIFEFTDIPLERLMQKAKAMVVAESSSCFYAMAFGCRIVIPRFEDGLDCNPLSFLCDIPDYVYSSEELRVTCDRAVVQPPAPAELATTDVFFKRYFYFPNYPAEYLDVMDRLKPFATNP